MRINIIGPSGSGKTTLAQKLSKILNIDYVSLDYVFYTYDVKKRIPKTESEWMTDIDQIIQKQNWIIEGVRPIQQVTTASDLIIFLHPPLLVSIYRQWYRYIMDPVQRKEHGFINNLKLTRYLVKQYFETEDLSKENDPKYVRLKKIERLLKKHINKIRIVRNNKDLQQLLIDLRHEQKS